MERERERERERGREKKRNIYLLECKSKNRISERVE